jgi:hypothetical protein
MGEKKTLPFLPYTVKRVERTGCWWLMAVILATWEAEIRRTMV